MNPEQQFQTFFQADLVPVLEQFESRRVQIVRKVKTAGLVTALVVLVIAAFIMGLTPEVGWALIPLTLGVFVFAGIYSYMTKDYVAEFKANVVGRIVTFISPELTYHPDQCISELVYGESRIFLTQPDRYRGEDLVQGRVGQTQIRFSELHTEYRTVTHDSKGRRQEHWHTIFKGIFFVADFNKHFQGETVVLPDTAEKLFGRLGQKLQSWNVARKGDLVRLEDVAFEKRFVVYSDDQVEARYLLSPSLMARIMEYAERTGREVSLSFVNSNINVAIPSSKNAFEPKLFSTVLDEKVTREYLDDLLLAIDIVEDLNLNTRIWSKQ